MNSIAHALIEMLAVGFGTAAGVVLGMRLADPRVPTTRPSVARPTPNAAYTNDDRIIEVLADQWANDRGTPDAAPLFASKVRLGQQIARRRQTRKWLR